MTGLLGLYVFAHDANYMLSSALYTPDFITLCSLPAITLKPDFVFSDSVSLEAWLNFPGISIGTWEWTLAHLSNSSFNKTASGAAPTLDDLAPGMYNVSLKATDAAGNVYTDASELFVADTTGYYTQDQLNQLLEGERAKWDVQTDGVIGLEEAVQALQVVAGLREDPIPAAAGDFAGNWVGAGTFDATDEHDEFTVSISLTSDGTTVSGTLEVGDGPILNITGTVAGGKLYFPLPLGADDVGNPDCADWNVQTIAALDETRTVLTVNASGTFCGDGGGKPGTFNATLNKQ